MSGLGEGTKMSLRTGKFSPAVRINEFQSIKTDRFHKKTDWTVY